MKRTLWLSALLLTAACGGDSTTNDPTGPAPDFNFSVSPATLTVVIGEEGEFEVALTRSGGFSGSVTVTADNLPRGVTSAPTTLLAGETHGTMTLTVGVTGEPGVFALTIRASAQGLSQKSTDAILVTRIVT